MREKDKVSCGRRVHTGLPPVLALAAALAILNGCSHAEKVFRETIVPPEPGSYARTLPAPPRTETKTALELLPDNWQELAQRLSLADIVNIGLANNTVTRRTWLAARAAAAQVGINRAAYFPTVDVDGNLAHTKQSAIGGRFSFSQDVYGAAGTLNLLLFDFGGRDARFDEAWAGLLAADYAHNAAIQDVILNLEEGYYSYLGTKAQLSAAEANVREAEVNLEAARRRHEVGVATVADVLKARTALSEAQLLQQSLSGHIEALRGELATAMGIPASTPFDVGILPMEVAAEEITQEVEPLIEQALSSRPDLGEARWQAEQALARLKSAKAEGWPSISARSSAGRTYYFPGAFEKHDNNWSASLLLNFPLFTGLAHTHEVKKAQAEAEASQTQATHVEQQVVLDVWTGYADLKTAAQRVKTTRDLLASAEESERVALAQYKQGVGSILDLLTAQASLASARAQEILARSDWLLAMASLARATGALAPPLEQEDATRTTTRGSGEERR
jgi:outer membrane protein TolC